MKQSSTRKLTRIETKERHKNLSCKVFTVKVDTSKLSKPSLQHLNKLFLEAKWLYNFVLSQEKPFEYNTKSNHVEVKVIDKFEPRELTNISSQMKQGIQNRVVNAIVALSKKKEKGMKVGALKFKSRVNSVPLKQYKTTYSINFEENYIKLQGLKQKIKVNGLNQIPKEAEIANSNLLKIGNNFFFKITTYVKKEKKVIPDKAIGIDFGCSTQLTLSNGQKIEFQVPVSKKVRTLDRKISKSREMSKKRKSKYSNNYHKMLRQREEAYRKLNDKKKDIRNKVVSTLTNSCKAIAFQNENIRGWSKGRHGKKIQFSGIGGIIQDLKNKSYTPIEVNRFFPSTQLCSVCGEKQKLELWDRTYECKKCNEVIDRDVNAAKNILSEGIKMLKEDKNYSTECRGTNLLETKTSVLTFSGLPESVKISLCQ